MRHGIAGISVLETGRHGWGSSPVQELAYGKVTLPGGAGSDDPMPASVHAAVSGVTVNQLCGAGRQGQHRLLRFPDDRPSRLQRHRRDRPGVRRQTGPDPPDSAAWVILAC
ncbi:hypothetical protein [Streptomyces sp900105755]|uniref:Uncharacterized protein n=1 Tax=Streptomyces sp. 900105755 TaxID=3154389 RepID=A0ABV1TQW0_9ACTN